MLTFRVAVVPVIGMELRLSVCWVFGSVRLVNPATAFPRESVMLTRAEV